MVRKLVPDVVRRQRLLKLPATATVREAAQRMARRNVRSALVVDGTRLEGIFTGTDLIDVVARGLDPDATPLSAVMTPDPETVKPDSNAIEALRRMHKCRCRHLPIVDEAGKLVGIVSRRDFLGYEEDEIEREERLWEEL